MLNWISNHNVLIYTWLAAFGTISIYTILYRENALYRVAEHVFIGAAAGYTVYTAWTETLKPQWWDKMVAGQWYWIFALIAGAMFYFIYSEKHVWISRLIFGAFLGLIAGNQFKSFAGTNIDQIHASFKPIVGVGLATSLNNIVIIFVLLTVMAYFFFSFEHKSAVQKAPSVLGRWVLMFAFGAMFGATVMARMALLIGRINFLLNIWIRGMVFPELYGLFHSYFHLFVRH